MSRQYAHAYQIDNPTRQQRATWEQIIDDHAHLFPEAVCEGGGSGPEQLDVWLWCNRTKARVYKQRLDAVFGADGRIVDLNKEYAE